MNNSESKRYWFENHNIFKILSEEEMIIDFDNPIPCSPSLIQHLGSTAREVEENVHFKFEYGFQIEDKVIPTSKSRYDKYEGLLERKIRAITVSEGKGKEDNLDEYPTHVSQLSEYDFYILNLIENKSIAINVIEDNQYTGITFYKTNLGWELNPTKIGKGYLSNMKDALDYTNDFEKAKQHADQTL